MNVAELMQSKYLGKNDVPSPIVATIASAKLETMKFKSGTETKTIMEFHGNLKPMIVNKGNLKTLTKLFGPETDNWIGKQVEIWVNPNVEYEGETVGGLRFRAPGTSGLPAPSWTWAEVIKNCSAAGLNEEQVRQALKESGRTTFKSDRDTPFIQSIINDAQGGGAGDEIPI